MAKDTIGNSAYGLLGCKIATETIVRWLTMIIKCPYCKRPHDEHGTINIHCPCGAVGTNRFVEIYGLPHGAFVWSWLPSVSETPPNTACSGRFATWLTKILTKLGLRR